MLIINNRFLSVYDYNFLLFYEKIFSVKPAVDEKLFGWHSINKKRRKGIII
jgi:hypothetical protein